MLCMHVIACYVCMLYMYVITYMHNMHVMHAYACMLFFAKILTKHFLAFFTFLAFL